MGNGTFSPSNNNNNNQKSNLINHSQTTHSQLFDNHSQQSHHHHHHHHNHNHQQPHQHNHHNSNPINTTHKFQTHNSNFHGHSSCISGTNNNHHQPDPELIELFEYTSQFNMEDTINSNIINNNNSNNQLHAESSSESASSTQSSPPVDLMNKTKLDLTIEGHTITKPKWWADTIINHDSINSLQSGGGSTLLINSGMNNVNGLIAIQRYNTNTQDDECDSSLFINQHNLQTTNGNVQTSSSSSLSHGLNNIIELKDLLFSTNDDNDESSSASSRSSASLTLSASNFNVDNFISYSSINPNSITIKNEIDEGYVERIAEKLKKEENNSENTLKIKEEQDAVKPHAVNGCISSFIVLPSLNDNKTARKRIYTHQNKVNSLLMNHQHLQGNVKVETNPKSCSKSKK